MGYQPKYQNFSIFSANGQKAEKTEDTGKIHENKKKTIENFDIMHFLRKSKINVLQHILFLKTIIQQHTLCYDEKI